MATTQLEMGQRMTDEQLWDAFQAGDHTALVEIERRWERHLLKYVEQRGGAAEIVQRAFDRLASHRGPLDCVRWALYCTAHVLTGASIDWRNGVVLITPESGFPAGFPGKGLPDDPNAVAL
jgi:hypothetical protein